MREDVDDQKNQPDSGDKDDDDDEDDSGPDNAVTELEEWPGNLGAANSGSG